MEQLKIWQLVAKKLSGEASRDELLDLERLLKEHPELHYPLETINDLWKHSGETDKEESMAAYHRHLERMQRLNIPDRPGALPGDISMPGEKSNKPRRRWLLAGITGLAALSLWFALASKSLPAHKTSLPATEQKGEISTRNGSRTKMVLPDGSSVWLNSGSRLSYNPDYGREVREVTLAGEAFFEVVPLISSRSSEKIPFIIHAGRIEIRVLGTAFNVRSYPMEKRTEASLIRGSIEVTFRDRAADKVVLHPNEKIVVLNDNQPMPVQARALLPVVNHDPLVTVSHLSYLPADSSVVETAWMQNKLVFQDKSFRELATEMERWYGIDIHFDDSRRDTLHFTGSFENETIQQALNALRLTNGKTGGGFHYRIDHNDILITK